MVPASCQSLRIIGKPAQQREEKLNSKARAVVWWGECLPNVPEVPGSVSGTDHISQVRRHRPVTPALRRWTQGNQKFKDQEV